MNIVSHSDNIMFHVSYLEIMGLESARLEEKTFPGCQ